MKYEKNQKTENKMEALPAKEREQIREIERLPLFIGDKIDLILVWRGLKPATDLNFVFKKWGAGDPEPDLSDERKQIRCKEFKEFLKRLGLQSAATEEERNEAEFKSIKEGEQIEIEGTESQRFFVAREFETAQKLFENFSQASEKSEELGKLFGFPESAVTAYKKYWESGMQEDSTLLEMKRGALPPEIEKQDYMAFAQFRLSKEHWQEELEIAKKWAAEIQKISPTLYAEMVNTHRKIKESEQ